MTLFLVELVLIISLVTFSPPRNILIHRGSIGGSAAILAKNSIKNVEVLDNEEDGMEAVWKIDVEDFPAFIVVDDKGDDFFKEWLG